MADSLNAIVAEVSLRQPAPDGPLSGLSFAAKDNIDVAGLVTGAGNPTWAATHGPATRSAPVIDALINAGAQLIAKTHLDELAYSLNGENVHYGTPANPRGPGHIPGGSSSGSASLVAGGVVPFALGSDTAGSVRVPASYCGLWGLRTTHGAISTEGVVPLAQSFDVVGPFASHPYVLNKVAQVLLGNMPLPKINKIVLLRDAVYLADQSVQEQCLAAWRVLASAFATTQEVELGEGFHLKAREAFRVIQAFEVWANHGQWVRQAQPQFGPGIKERFEVASKIAGDEASAARRVREQLVNQFHDAIESGCVVLLPTAPGPAPLLNAGLSYLEQFRGRALQMLSPAGLLGQPQITIPLKSVDLLPIGLSILGPANSDLFLCQLAVRCVDEFGLGRDFLL